MNPTRPAWIDNWCRRELGSTPVENLLVQQQMSTVVGLRLADGRCVVVKGRPDERGRAVACVAVQTYLAEAGMPVARPITPARIVDGFAVHAEEWRPGGEMRRGDEIDRARASAQWLARITDLTGAYPGPPPPASTNPIWVGWNQGAVLWPPARAFDERAKTIPMPPELDDVVRRARSVLTATGLPDIVGHADWETQNLRWEGERMHTVHDWDSLAWVPEAAIVGAASGSFASAEVPTLAPVASSAAFIEQYQQTRRRVFSVEELHVAWAASIYPAAHNSRGEILHAHEEVAWAALREQAEERLSLAVSPVGVERVDEAWLDRRRVRVGVAVRGGLHRPEPAAGERGSGLVVRRARGRRRPGRGVDAHRRPTTGAARDRNRPVRIAVVLGLLSIGMLLVPAAVLCAVGALRAPTPPEPGGPARSTDAR